MSETCNGSGCSQAGSSACGSCAGTEEAQRAMRLRDQLAMIGSTVLVMSGKGGVGKSTVAVNLAVSLALSGKTVGLLDVDFHGPSIPTLMGLTGQQVANENGKLLPISFGGVKVMSVGLLVDHADAAVIWRGPMKAGVIQQLIGDVAWGELDYLIIDCPPGTGDEPLSVCQTIPELSGALIVTTPQKVAVADVRRSISFCRQLEIPVLGVVENMSGFVCGHCDKVTDVFTRGGGEAMAADMGVPFLGRVPMDPMVAQSGDEGKPFVHFYGKSATAKAFEEIIEPILALSDSVEPEASEQSSTQGKAVMRYAVPLAEGKLCMHFGHCEQFALIDVDPSTKTIITRENVTPPPHEPGLLPKWLGEKGVTHIIAGGMGQRAQGLFAEQEIAVAVGAPAETPEALVQAHLSGTLVSGQNACDH